MVAAGVDPAKPRKWENLPELAGNNLTDTAKEQLRLELTLLTVALLLGNERVAHKLMALPSSNTKRWSPLEQAIIKGKGTQVKELLASGANPYARGKCGTLPACLAAVVGKKDCIKEIFSCGKSIEKAKAAKGKTLSRFEDDIVSMGSAEINPYAVSLALEKGSVAEFRIAIYSTSHAWDAPANYPLWLDILNTFSDKNLSLYNERTMMRIFQKAAEPALPPAYSAVLKNDVNALKKALETTDKQMLEGNPRRSTPCMLYAITARHNECLRVLLDAGISPESTDFHGELNMLLVAHRVGNKEAFKMLVEKGADLSASFGHGNSVFDCLYNSQDKQTLGYIMSQPSFKEDSIDPLRLA